MTPPTTITTTETLPDGWVVLPIPERIYNDAVQLIDRLMNGEPQARPRPTSPGTFSGSLSEYTPGRPVRKRTGFVPCSHCGHSPKSHSRRDHSCRVCQGREQGAGAMYAGDCPGWNGTPGAEPTFTRRDTT